MNKYIKYSCYVAAYLVFYSTVSVLSYMYFSRDKYTMPKVGECYERAFYVKSTKEVEFEIRKVIKVNPKDRYSAITYVYNMLNEVGFESGKWYYNKYLCSESLNMFFADGIDFVEVRKTNCPW